MTNIEPKPQIQFTAVLRVLEMLTLFALLGLVVYALVFGVKTDEVREHYRISLENEQKMLEILDRLENTEKTVEEIKEEVKP